MMRLLNRFICPVCHSGFVEVYEISKTRERSPIGERFCLLTKHYAACDCLTKRCNDEDKTVSGRIEDIDRRYDGPQEFVC